MLEMGFSRACYSKRIVSYGVITTLVTITLFTTGCSVPLSLAKQKCSQREGCISTREIHQDQLNSITVSNMKSNDGCSRSEITHYVNFPKDGWQEVGSEEKSDCEEESLKGIKEKFETWKKSGENIKRGSSRHTG